MYNFTAKYKPTAFAHYWLMYKIVCQTLFQLLQFTSECKSARITEISLRYFANTARAF